MAQALEFIGLHGEANQIGRFHIPRAHNRLRAWYPLPQCVLRGGVNCSCSGGYPVVVQYIHMGFSAPSPISWQRMSLPVIDLSYKRAGQTIIILCVVILHLFQSPTKVQEEEMVCSLDICWFVVRYHVVPQWPVMKNELCATSVGVGGQGLVWKFYKVIELTYGI